MRSIDIHAHLTPQCFWKATEDGGDWHTMRRQQDARGSQVAVIGESRVGLPPKTRWTPEERLADMDSLGVDIHVLSPYSGFYNYELDLPLAVATSRDSNDEIHQMAKTWPDRFAGLVTLPVQDVPTAIRELDSVVNGKNWDEPEYLPLFKAAEEMGAVLFFHPQPSDNILLERIQRYGLSNSIGVPLEDALVVAVMIFGGIMEKCPNLKVCIAHGGGPACFGMGRMDRGWQVRSEARTHISHPPSTYQRRMYYDCVTMSETALRFLIDTVGADRVVLGSDWPFVRWDPSPVGWVQGLESLTQAEKDQILWQNLEQLLGI